MKTKMIRTIFFVSQSMGLFGAEKLQENLCRDPFGWLAEENLFLHDERTLSPLGLEELELLVSGEIVVPASNDENDDDDDNEKLPCNDAGYSLLLEQPNFASSEKLPEVNEIASPCDEKKVSVKRRRRSLPKVVSCAVAAGVRLHNGSKISGRHPYRPYHYCRTCNVEFLYWDEEGRHKKRNPSLCDGYPKG